jgi:hypothetical protein
MRRYIYLLLGLSLLVVGNGCVTTAVGSGAGAGVGTYAYIKGELEVVYAVPLEDVWLKALEAIQGELKLTIDSKYVDGIGGKISARRADGTRIKVRFEALGSHSTVIGVHVGTFGSRDFSKRIHTAIHNQLST